MAQMAGSGACRKARSSVGKPPRPLRAGGFPKFFRFCKIFLQKTLTNAMEFDIIATVPGLRNCVKVARQTLTLFVGVRIPIPQPKQKNTPCGRFFVLCEREGFEPKNREFFGGSPVSSLFRDHEVCGYSVQKKRHHFKKTVPCRIPTRVWAGCKRKRLKNGRIYDIIRQ